MSEVIEQIKQTTAFMGKGDTRKRYPGTCPKCGKTMFICKSIAMLEGINTGNGSCPQCGLFLHIEFDPENQRMNLEPFGDARTRALAEQKGEKTDDE